MKRTPLIAALYFIITVTQTSTAVSQWIQTTFPGGNSVYQISVSPNHHLYVSANGTLQSSNHGDTWEKFSTYVSNTIFDHGAIGFTTNGLSEIYRTLDTGNSWQLIHEYPSGVGLIYPVAIAPNGTVYGLGFHWPNHLFFVSKDNGTTWDSLPGLKMKEDSWTTEVISLAISSNGVLFAGSNSGLFSSTDEGKSWKKKIVVDENDKILSIAFNSKNHIFAGTSNLLMRSTDDGNTWSQSWEPPFTCSGISSIVVDPADRIFIGTECYGMLYSPDNGVTWIAINDTLYDWNITSIAIDPDGYVYTADGGYVYRRLLSTLGAPASVSQSVSSSMSTYPNPFTASTTITFSTDKPANNQVSIYNLLGFEVAQLFSGPLDAGKHSFTWDAHTMPAGMYFCMIRDGADVKKIPLILASE